MALTISNLQHRYNDTKQIIFPDIQIDEGQELLVLGPSGSGKTTLLHLLAGILPVQTGDITFNGKNLRGMKSSELTKFRKENLGIIFQTPKFIRSLTIAENINAVKYFSGRDNTKAETLLAELNILDLKNTLPEKCSTGEQQRASIACALINSPGIILADEPTSALDDENCQAAIDLLRKVAHSRNSILVVVTHDTRLKDSFANKIIFQ